MNSDALPIYDSDALLIYNIGEGATAFSTKKVVEATPTSICQHIGIDERMLVKPHQVHGTEIRQIASDFIALPGNIRQMVLDGVDAVMTDVEGVCVGVSTADCIPILLYEPTRKVACAVHAGWRGTAKRIVEKAIHTMVITYKINPQNLRAIICPGISLDSFEVGDEVFCQFAEANFPMETIARKQPALKPEYAAQEKWHIDLPICNKLQMESMGVKPENIKDIAIDTYTHADEYFSARRQDPDTGRIFSGIIINP